MDDGSDGLPPAFAAGKVDAGKREGGRREGKVETGDMEGGYISR